MRALRTAVFAFALAASAAALACATPAAALDPAKLLELDAVSCDAIALDGNTLLCSLTAPEDLAGQSLHLRLWGIMVPAMRETEGWHSRAALDALQAATRPAAAPPHDIAATVVCAPKARQGLRLVAVCRTENGQDLAEAVIAAGWATEYRASTREGPQADPDLAARYAAAERLARAEGLGVWVGTAPITTHDRAVLAAWAQAILSAAAVIAAAFMAQWFGWKLHNDNIERAEAEQRRIARNHMLPVILEWSGAQALVGKMIDAMEQLNLATSEGGINDERYRQALGALANAARLAETEFSSLEIPRDARTYLDPATLDELVDGKMCGKTGTIDALEVVDAMGRLPDSTNNPRYSRANPNLTPQKLQERGQRHLDDGIDRLKRSRDSIGRVIERLLGEDASDSEPKAKRS